MVDEIQERINALIKNLMKIYEGSKITNELVFDIPVFEAKNSKILDFAENLLNKKPLQYPASTDAGILQKIGMDVIIYGAGKISEAHKSDEKLLVSDLKSYTDSLFEFIVNFD